MGAMRIVDRARAHRHLEETTSLVERSESARRAVATAGYLLACPPAEFRRLQGVAFREGEGVAVVVRDDLLSLLYLQ